MKNIKFLSINIVLVVVFFLGCSSREYFKPTKEQLKTQTLTIQKQLPSKIVYFTNKQATTQNGIEIPANIKLPKNFVGIDKDLAKYGDKLFVNGNIVTFKSLVVTAKKRKNLVAVLLGDNTFKLYDLASKKVIFSHNFGPFLAVRKFIAQPYFYKELLLIPTLNGSMGIYDIKQNKLIREVVVSKKDYFNNIIYLGVVKDNLIVASRDNIVLIAPGVDFSKSFTIKHILVDEDGIYVFDVSGMIYKLNFSLKVVKKINLAYANVVSPTIYKNNIYFVENGENNYLVKISKNLSKVSVYPLECGDLDELNTFAKNGILYMGDKYLYLKDIK